MILNRLLETLKAAIDEAKARPEPPMTPRAGRAILAAKEGTQTPNAKTAFIWVASKECCASNVLRQMNIDTAKLVGELEKEYFVPLDEALKIAREEQKGFAHPYLGTEHLLLSMIRCVPKVAKTFEAAGLSLDAARQRVLWELDPNRTRE